MNNKNFCDFKKTKSAINSTIQMYASVETTYCNYRHLNFFSFTTNIHGNISFPPLLNIRICMCY